MDRFQEMRVFAAVVDAGSFVGACDATGMSKPAVSRHVATLESRLGVRLLQRTTRRLSLTDEGEVFYARCKELLGEVDEAEAEVASRAGQAIGQLRINAPVSFALIHLASLWPLFMSRHPGVTLDITLADRVVDLVEEGADLAVRIARMPDSTLVCRKLGSTRLVLCATPAYLRENGTPRHPSDIAAHSVLAYSLLSARYNWEFDGPKGRVEVKVTPRIYTNSGDTCRAAALQDLGIILQPTFLIGADLRSGALVEVLPQYRALELGIYAVYPTRRHVPPKVRLMIDFLVDAFREPSWPE